MLHLIHRQLPPDKVTKMENKNITNDEINKITQNSKIREKAFFTIVRQSGLKPSTIKQLKIKHLERIREPDTPIPCKISVLNEIEKAKFGQHPSFIAEEAIKSLKNYLMLREINCKEKLTPESLLFVVNKNPNEQISVREMNRRFKRTAKRFLKGNPSLFQLNDLRKFFKQKSKEIGHNHINYLIGEIVDNSYIPEDDESYRMLYQEAKDSLNTEPAMRSSLYTREIQIEDLKKQLAKDSKYIGSILSLIHEMDNYSPDDPVDTHYIGDDLLELWQKAVDLQSEALLDRWTNNQKYPPYIDIPLTLTNIFKEIIKTYENLEKDEKQKGE